MENLNQEAAALMGALLEFREQCPHLSAYQQRDVQAAALLIKATRLLIEGEGVEVAQALNAAIWELGGNFYELGHLVPLVERYREGVEAIYASNPDW